MALRHVFAHACELELNPDKLALFLEYAHRVAVCLPALVVDFIREVAREQPGPPMWRERSGDVLL